MWWLFGKVGTRNLMRKPHKAMAFLISTSKFMAFASFPDYSSTFSVVMSTFLPSWPSLIGFPKSGWTFSSTHPSHCCRKLLSSHLWLIIRRYIVLVTLSKLYIAMCMSYSSYFHSFNRLLCLPLQQSPHWTQLDSCRPFVDLLVDTSYHSPPPTLLWSWFLHSHVLGSQTIWLLPTCSTFAWRLLGRSLQIDSNTHDRSVWVNWGWM